MSKFYELLNEKAKNPENKGKIVYAELPAAIGLENYQKFIGFTYSNFLTLVNKYIVEIKKTFRRDYSKEIQVNPDYELGDVKVTYISLEHDYSYLKDFPMIVTNGTEKGNNRIPLTEVELMNLFNGYKTSMQKTLKR